MVWVPRARDGGRHQVVTRPGASRDVRPPAVYRRRIKPLLDRLVGLLVLVVLVPVLVGLALVVLLSLGRPVLFVQQRVGHHGRPFPVFKFRTMQQDRRRVAVVPAVERRATHKSDADPRHTRTGRLLRRWSLDELPQLLNIVRGEMSLVGPRPELPHVVARYEVWQHRRHEVRPGLTGLWQITARGQGAMHERVDLDIAYVERCSFRTDLGILVRTVPAMVGRCRGT